MSPEARSSTRSPCSQRSANVELQAPRWMSSVLSRLIPRVRSFSSPTSWPRPTLRAYLRVPHDAERSLLPQTLTVLQRALSHWHESIFDRLGASRRIVQAVAIAGGKQV